MVTSDAYFAFTTRKADLERGMLTFGYELRRNKRTWTFAETIGFNAPVKPPKDDAAFSAVLQALHLALGMSYWKTFCPGVFKMEDTLSRGQAEFWNTVYTKGLGEFFYQNSIDFRRLVAFPNGASEPPRPAPREYSRRALVLLGAGKDSIVTGELMKRAGMTFAFITLNPTPIHREVARRMGVSLIEVTRRIDPTLFELNTKSSTYNGHVPITAVFSGIALFMANLLDYRYVIASNEESANYGNVTYLGSEINHQWSKSLEFEKLFRGYMARYVSPAIEYFSLLRPLTEFHIAKLFSHHQIYFDAFTSCNTNFKITGNRNRELWCGKCPKCTFVFLILAAWLPKQTVIEIFGSNLLDDASLIPLYKELLGIAGFKPFECVGTPLESQAAWLMIEKTNAYQGDAVVKAVTGDVQPLLQGNPVAYVLKKFENHCIPKPFVGILNTI